MSLPQMNYTFVSAAAVGALVALIGGATAFALTPIVGSEAALIWAATFVACVHHGFLLKTAQLTAGRVVGPVTWLLGAVVLHATTDSLFIHLTYWLTTTYLVTVLLHHRRVLPMIGVATLLALGAAGFAWAFGVTGSLAAGLWCFFLVLATAASTQNHPDKQVNTQDDAGFDTVARTAEAALSQVGPR